MYRLNRLKYRIILSHVLPILATVPLVAASVYYAMQMQIVVNDLRQLIFNESQMIRDYADSNPTVWENPAAAERMINEIRSELVSGVILFDRNFRFLAGSDNEYHYQPLNFPLAEVSSIPGAAENPISSVPTSPLSRSDIQIVVPVMSNSKVPLGMIRLRIPSQYFDNMLGGLKLRIMIILIAGAILAVFLALFTSHGIEQRLSQTTDAIFDLSTGVRNQPLPVSGPPELSRLSNAFNTLSSQLDESEQSRRKLLSYLGHELGRPLGGLSSATDALRHGAMKDERLANDLLRGMKNEIRRLELLVNDLSLLRGSGDPTVLYIIRSVNTSEWLTELVTYWAEFMKTKDIDFTYEINEDMPAIHMDERRMHQALGNLLNNAIKYSSAGQSAMLRATLSNGVIEISVVDHGVGIQPEDLPNIYEPFYRGSNKKRYIQGMGVGLTITRDIILAHQGEISVESEPGVQTVFTIRLPIERLNAIPLGEHIINNSNAPAQP